MAEAIFSSMPIGEGKAEHSSSLCHPFVPVQKQSSSTQYQHPILTQWKDRAAGLVAIMNDLKTPSSLLTRDDMEIKPHVDGSINY